MIVLKLPVKLSGQILILLHKFLSHASNQIRDAMEVMLEQPMNGFIKITLLIKHVPHIKHSDMIMELVVTHKSNAGTVYQTEDAGHNKEQKFIQLTNMEMSKDNRR